MVLLVLGLLVFAVPSHADVFDGSAGPKLAVPSVDKAALAAAASPRAAMEQPVPQSGADLFYFTKEQADLANKIFGFRSEARGYTFDADVPADIQSQMRSDLAFVAGLLGSGATKLHHQIFGPVGGAAYSKFFETRVSAIGMNGCGNGNAVACVIPFWNPSKMWLTKNYIKFSHPQVSRMMVVYHEARHTESRNGNWPHASCPRPFRDAQGRDMKSIWTGALLAGEPACDETPFGSYGSSTIMLKNIAKFCTNCTDKVKMDAALYADDQLGRIIDADARRQMQDDLGR
ncbi:MAG: hypothetical protein A2521_06170 [Deltaproteobacteria bacterium RIFOXYD12_FULL_57_12]|nr:MAG: hypothetical protein A2521_06170 [Deltaproteobacteria bacterium RIFOXYD12_FULL_57_12]